MIDQMKLVEGIRDYIAAGMRAAASKIKSESEKLREEMNQQRVADAERFATLHRRIDQLEEARREFRYCGTWQRGASYREGTFLTDDGSLWTCLRDTSARPGTSADWQLCVKRGRDGRDA